MDELRKILSRRQWVRVRRLAMDERRAFDDVIRHAINCYLNARTKDWPLEPETSSDATLAA